MSAALRQAIAIGLMLGGLTACVPTTRIGGQAVPVQSGREQRIASLETALADALIQIEKLKSVEVEAAPLSEMPANAKDGQCYARLLVPAQYVDRVEQRIVKEASETQETVPAKTEWVEERVLISEAHVQLQVVPATYKWVEERTEVLPARSHQKLIKPAQYKTVIEQVLETPAEMVWRPGRGSLEKIDEQTGEILHRVEIPARYRDVEKKVLTNAAIYKTVIEPAVFELNKKKVVDVPEHTVQMTVPAQYKTVRVQRVVTPEKVVRHRVPPVYKSFSYREKIADESLDWRRIPCMKDKNETLYKQLQQALNQAGFDAGYPDGIWGKRTEAAIYAFQVKKGLATGRLSVETLEALGIGL